jgi:hypothetical protein
MHDSRARLWFALFALVVFVAGLAGGVVVTKQTGLRFDGDGRPRRGPARMGPRGGGPPPGFLLDRLAGDLDLTTEQRTRVAAILRAREERLDEFRRQIRQRFESEQKELQGELEKVLSPEQQKKFEEMMSRRPRRGLGGFRPPLF